MWIFWLFLLGVLEYGTLLNFFAAVSHTDSTGRISQTR